MNDRIVRLLLPFGTLFLFFVIMAVFGSGGFFTLTNFTNVLERSSIYIIVGVGMTFVIITAGIDLSVGSMMGLSGMVGGFVMHLMVTSWMMGPEDTMLPNQVDQVILWAGTFAGILTGALLGFLNGILITRLKLHPFIVTLGHLSVFRGACLLINLKNPFNLPYYHAFLDTDILGIPVPVMLAILCLLTGFFLLKFTRFGRHVFAIGSNREAAFHTGINVNWTLIMVYTLTGLLAGIAGLIMAARASTAQPTAAKTYELYIIAAVVIGGTSLLGGRGGLLGTFVGALLILFLRNGFRMLNLPESIEEVSSEIQLVVVGYLIILAVAVDQFARSKLAARRNA